MLSLDKSLPHHSRIHNLNILFHPSDPHRDDAGPGGRVLSPAPVSHHSGRFLDFTVMSTYIHPIPPFGLTLVAAHTVCILTLAIWHSICPDIFPLLPKPDHALMRLSCLPCITPVLSSLAAGVFGRLILKYTTVQNHDGNQARSRLEWDGS